MSRAKNRSRMKVIYGGKQLSFIKDTEEVLNFLQCVAGKSPRLRETLETQLSACQLYFSRVPEEQDHLSWILEQINELLNDQNEQTRNLVRAAIENYQDWSKDPFGWEREHTSEKAFTNTEVAPTKKSERLLTFPVRADLCVEVKLPEGGLSVDEFHRLGLFLYPYCNDLDLTKTFSWIGSPEKT